MLPGRLSGICMRSWVPASPSREGQAGQQSDTFATNTSKIYNPYLSLPLPLPLSLSLSLYPSLSLFVCLSLAQSTTLW